MILTKNKRPTPATRSAGKLPYFVASNPPTTKETWVLKTPAGATVIVSITWPSELAKQRTSLQMASLCWFKILLDRYKPQCRWKQIYFPLYLVITLFHGSTGHNWSNQRPKSVALESHKDLIYIPKASKDGKIRWISSQMRALGVMVYYSGHSVFLSSFYTVCANFSYSVFILKLSHTSP